MNEFIKLATLPHSKQIGHSYTRLNLTSFHKAMWFLYLDEMVGEYSNFGRFLRTFFPTRDGINFSLVIPLPSYLSYSHANKLKAVIILER